MEGAVHRFVRFLRLAGMSISVSEQLDALKAAAQPGVLAERPVLREALAVCLVKDRRDVETFYRIFDLFFSLRPVVPPEDEHGHSHDDLEDGGDTNDVTLSQEPSETPEEGHSHGKPQDIKEFFKQEDLAQSYNLHQEANKIDLAAMTDEIVLSTDQKKSALGEAARVELRASRLHGGGLPGDLSSSEQADTGIELTVAQELALLDWLAGQATDDGADPQLLADLRRRLGGLLGDLPEMLRGFLEKLLAMDDAAVESPGSAKAQARRLADEAKRAELEATLRRLVRSLHGAPRSRRRASSAGRVDGGRTMRASMRFDGIPFRPITVSKVEDRPRLVVLADVSLSVRATSGFTLDVVHGLHDLVSQVRSWAFVADIAETTDLFAEHPPQQALAMVVAGTQDGGVLDIDADSDYGSVFTQFLAEDSSALTRRTTLVVLGDGRGNGKDPGLRPFEEMTRRVRETIWLTPEPSYSWGLGRCDLPLYADFCDRVEVVRDLGGLDRFASAAGVPGLIA